MATAGVPLGRVRRDYGSAAMMVGLALVGIVVSFGVAQQPWLMAGAVFGAIVLAIAISAPIALLAMALILGVVDLSFMAGNMNDFLPGLDMNAIRLVGATLGFTAFIMNAPAARNAILGTYGRFYVLFLAAAALSLTISFDSFEGIRLLLKLTYPFLTFLLVIGICDTKEKVEQLVRYTLIAATVIIFLITPLFTLESGYRVDALGYKRIRGVGAHENPFSFYMMILLFIAFTRLIFRRQLRYLVFCAGAGVWIVMTMTRITYLATIVGILVISLLTSVAQRQYRALAAGLLVTLIVAVPGLPFILDRSLGFVPGPSELIELVTHPIALYESINWQGRTNLWPIVWTGFVASPIIGLGLGSSSFVIRQYFPEDAAQVAHNEYLRLAADMGIIGILLFTIAMAIWLVGMLRASVQRDTEVAEFATPAVAGIVGWAIIAITDNPFDAYMPFTQYIGFLVGGAIAMRAIVEKKRNVDH